LRINPQIIDLCIEMAVKRLLENLLVKRMTDSKAIILLGPRQAGKTTLLRQLLEDSDNVLWLSGDDTDTREILSNPTSTTLKRYIGNHKKLVIDEAQRIENIGICIKLITDQIPGVKVFATGSSAFELANKVNEPLTGRKWEFSLYPFSFEEMANHHGLLTEQRLLEQRMVFGYYPDVVNNPGDETAILKQLADSYLYKDILTWERIQKPDRLEKLVQALAFQVGSLVSYSELGQMAGLNNETVEHYIHLLEKAYVVFRLGSYNRNLRNELKKSRKIYFYDCGLRNAIINNFNPLPLRSDSGALWENFLVSERMKHLAFHQRTANRYFWRTTAQQEIDYVEEKNGIVHCYEFKYSKKNTHIKFPKAFIESYHPEIAMGITPGNFVEFIAQNR
jgi:predicted AAA+ superfamily ATPase